MLFLSGIWIYFQKKLDQVDLGEGEGASSYAKHYLMISGEENTLMWDSIYESASQAAKDAAQLLPENIHLLFCFPVLQPGAEAGKTLKSMI